MVDSTQYFGDFDDPEAEDDYYLDDDEDQDEDDEARWEGEGGGTWSDES